MASPATTADTRPRVLHLIKWLPRGGIETWLSHVFAHQNADSPVRHEVLLMKEEIGPLGPKVAAAGVPIHTLPMTSKAVWFADLYRFLRKQGPFAVFHSHMDAIISGPALAVAAAAGVPARIAHNHAVPGLGADYRNLRNNLREKIGNTLSRRCATLRIGISNLAISYLAGPEWRSQPDCRVLYYGFDYSQFEGASERAAARRRELGIGLETRVLGHVGRFDPVKNHAFMLELFGALAQQVPESVLVFVGTGPLEGNLREQAATAGLADRVLFAGTTDDVASYLAMFDLFVFPSFSEGLGIVVLEAEAAGTPVLMSEGIPHEVVVIPDLVRALPLEAGPHAWAQEAAALLASGGIDPNLALATVQSSTFGMARCIRELDELYRGELSRTESSAVTTTR